MRAPLWAGFRVGGLPGEGCELGLSFMGVPYLGYGLEYDPSWVSFTASLKLAMLRQADAAAALLLTASAGGFAAEELQGTPNSWDGPARFPSLGAAIVGELGGGGARLFGSASLEASTYYPGWADMRWQTPGFFTWGRLRAGVESLVARSAEGDLGLALSAALRTEPLGSGFALADPVSFGAELHWYAGDSGLVYSAYAVGEYESRGSWYAGLGFGVGFTF
jgi:hypothetical protein